MTTQNQIQQAFFHDLPHQPGAFAWLIKGDFDHFKTINDLYGPLITDYLLDWTLEVIEKQLEIAQKRLHIGPILLSVTGDDLTIYVPPSEWSGVEILDVLWAIRARIETSFRQRYIVGALPLPVDFFDDLPPVVLERIKNDLEGLDIVLDFAPRQRGFLLLLPLDPAGSYRPALYRAIQVIRRESGKDQPFLDLRLDWLCGPNGCANSTFNKGFLIPPAVSFAACSTRLDASTPPDAAALYEQVSAACQSAMKVCKQQQKGVVLHQGQPARAGLPAHPARYEPFDTPLRWSSERFLRERLYFLPLARPLLFQFNPVYRLPKVPAESFAAEKYRGNGYGVGLKGINELLGPAAADRLIGQLISIFSKVIQCALVAKGLSPEQVSLAQFVDRFTVCCEGQVFEVVEIIQLVTSLARMFNAVSEDILIAQLRVNVVIGDDKIPGYHLFHQLAVTGLANEPSVVAGNPPVEVREFGSKLLREGEIAMEQNSFNSARMLDRDNGDISHTAASPNAG